VEYDLDRFNVGCEDDEFTDTSVEGLCGFVGSVCESSSVQSRGIRVQVHLPIPAFQLLKFHFGIRQSSMRHSPLARRARYTITR